MVGTYSQANYAAGNTYQDALARHRVRSGQRATSIDLGVMLDSGFAAARPHLTRNLIAQGYMAVTERDLLALLSYHCDPTAPVTSPLKTQVLTGLKTPAALRKENLPDSPWLERPLFSHLREMGKVESSSSSDHPRQSAEPDYSVLLSGVKSLDEAEKIVRSAIMKKLAKMTGLDEGDLDCEKPTFHYGVDSLGGIEIQRWLATRMRAEAPVIITMAAQSIRDLAMSVVCNSQFVPMALRGDYENKVPGSQNV